jgi:hypothetical protein
MPDRRLTAHAMTTVVDIVRMRVWPNDVSIVLRSCEQGAARSASSCAQRSAQPTVARTTPAELSPDFP